MNSLIFYGVLTLNIVFSVVNFYHGSLIWGFADLGIAAFMLYQLYKN